MSILVHAEVDGDRLDDDELIHESLLILIGGDETTRHVISGGMYELLRNPDQFEAAAPADPSLLDRAVEEMLRWVSPIKNMARTVTRDVELGGQQIAEGQKLLLLYPSANRDEAVFDDPISASTSSAPRTTTWRSASAPTSAWAPAWPASSSRDGRPAARPACPTSSSPATTAAAPGQLRQRLRDDAGHLHPHRPGRRRPRLILPNPNSRSNPAGIGDHPRKFEPGVRV